MSCFSFMSPVRKDIIKIKDTNSIRSHSTSSIDFSDSEREKEDVDGSELGRRGSLFKAKGINIEKPVSNRAKSFTFRELSTATRNFKATNLIGEGGFGKVYKGRLHSGQIVAIKQLNLNGHQGNYEFIVEILMLSFLRHPNLVNLIGYCVDRDERLLVYEYMQKGCLENQLFDPNAEKGPLDWNTRIKIAVGAAKGIEYLHSKVNPPVIFRDLKSSNILLDNDFNPKLSDFGLAKLGPSGDKTHVSTRVMGTYGYCAPEYAMTGKLSVKSDIYSFGVVLLELITGRKVLNYCKTRGVQNLVSWARPFLKDQRRFVELVDPQLQGRYSVRCLNHAVAIIAMCLQEQPHFRPLMSDVVEALEYLENQPYYPESRTRRSRSPHRHYLQNRVGA